MFSIELKYVIQIVLELERTWLSGERASTMDIRRLCGSEVMVFNNVMFHLCRSGWIDNGDFPALTVDLDGKSLFYIAEAINDPSANEHGYMYGWSAGSLSGNAAAVEFSRRLCEMYRTHLRAIPLTALICSLETTGCKKAVGIRNRNMAGLGPGHESGKKS